ncbi:MAG: pilus assembly protein PilM [Thermodesulfobacteriota bacterium]
MQQVFSLFSRSNRVLGIELFEDSAALVRTVSDKNGSRVADAEFCSWQEEEQPAQTLSRAVRDMANLRIPVVTTLSSNSYQVLQIHPPQVRESEMKLAVGWQIKDLINLPLEQTVIDYFPAPAVPGQGEIIYVVAADRNAVQRQVEFIQQARLKIRSIDIPELALRNIVLQDEDSKGNLALLYMEEEKGLILIFKQGDLCLSRKIRTGTADLQQAKDANPESDLLETDDMKTPAMESVLLDLQRTFDYFESNFRSNPVATLLLVPQIGDAPELQDYLQQNMDLSVRLLDLEPFMGEGFSCEEQGSYLLALGCSLKSG